MTATSDLILLDKDFQICGILEDYSELRWVRRYFACGEFLLTLPPGSRELAAGARYIYNPSNGETAVIEELKITVDAAGSRSLVLSGRMLESLLFLRVIYGTANIGGNAEAAARSLVAAHATVGERAIPKLMLGEAKGHPEEVAVQYSGISLGDAIYSMLGSVGLSPKLTYDYESSALIFTVESGLDRTQQQNENSWAIFSSEFENVRSSLYWRCDRDLRNFFYIAGEIEDDDSRKIVTLDLSDGGERRELFVDARSVRRRYKDENGVTHVATEFEYAEMLRGWGREVAAEHAAIELTVGTVADGVPPVYREDYDLGDLCDYTDTSLGIQRSMRIAEITELRSGGMFSVHLKLSDKRYLTY